MTPTELEEILTQTLEAVGAEEPLRSQLRARATSSSGPACP
jgi:hypothetical protein